MVSALIVVKQVFLAGLKVEVRGWLARKLLLNGTTHIMMIESETGSRIKKVFRVEGEVQQYRLLQLEGRLLDG